MTTATERPDRDENFAGSPEFINGPGEGVDVDSDATEHALSSDELPVATSGEARHGNDYTGDPDSGFYGAGSNEGEGNDNLERETTPGFQKDKWERGTLMPR
jgi:hypothetical protein